MRPKKLFAAIAAISLFAGTATLSACAPQKGPDRYVVVTPQYVVTYEAENAYAQAAATALKNALQTEWNLDLPVLADQNADEADYRYEILVGLTNRIDAADLTEEMTDEDWLVAETDGRILIAGENGVALDAALTHFLNAYIIDAARPALPEQTRDAGSVSLVRQTDDVTALQRGLQYNAVLEKTATFRSADNLYSILQGATYAKGKIYAAATYKQLDGTELTRILVVSPSGTVEKESEPLSLDHANAVTYVEKWDKLLVSHCQSADGHYNRYSLVDPETLQITDTRDLEKPFFAMAYDKETDRFFSGEWGGGTLDVWNGDLSLALSKEVAEPQSLSQSLFADQNAAYFVRSSQNNALAEIRIYDWECNLVTTVPVPTSAEPEAIFLIEGKTYVVCNDFAGAQALVYRLSFTAEG